MKATSDRLRDLNAQQKNIGKFRELHGGLDATRTKLEAAQQKVASLATKMKQVENPTRAMTREFNAAVKAAGALKTAGQQQAQQLQVMRERLAGAGIGTKDLANHERTLRREIEATNKTLTQQQQKLANSAAKQQRVAAASQHADKLRNTAGNMAAAGAGATAAGMVVGAPIVKGLNEAKHYQTEVGRVNALGLGDKVSAEAVAFARNMKTYGTSQLDNLQLMRDGMSAFADVHHAEMVAPTLAKMKFANHAFFGEAEGADNERKFMDMLKVIELRGGLESKEKFEAQANIVQQVITATGGRVGPNEWLNMIKTGGLAAKGLQRRCVLLSDGTAGAGNGRQPRRHLPDERIPELVPGPHHQTLGQEAGRVRPDWRQEQGQARQGGASLVPRSRRAAGCGTVPRKPVRMDGKGTVAATGQERHHGKKPGA